MIILCWRKARTFWLFSIGLSGNWRVASTAESTHAGKCFVPRNQRTTTQSSIVWNSSSDRVVLWRIFFTNFDRPVGDTVKYLVLTDKRVKRIWKKTGLKSWYFRYHRKFLRQIAATAEMFFEVNSELWPRQIRLNSKHV